ncbi:hypothetical protein FXB39_18260 [Nocardioides sp. BGMRC 2183]|nr:hypothetical protein FXB39_18260 [Nocardioides sp. BGMRC 2183]
MSDSDPCFPDPLAPTPDSPAALPRSLGRRELAGIAAVAAAAPVIALVPQAGHAAPGRGPATTPRRLRLQREPGSPVSALDVPLDVDSVANARTVAGGALRTPVLETTTSFSMLGVTWRSGEGRVRARARRVGGDWSGWRELPALHDGPDPDSAEGRRTPPATHPVWFGACDAVQVEISGGARRPVLALIDPGSRREDRVTAGREVVAEEDGTAQKAGGKVKQPKILTRKVWGANDKLRNGKPDRIGTVKQVHVHHTVNSNDYARKDVPGMIRGMYRYHTNNLGWADLGYNFLVDRFGRIWVGRKGSIRTGKNMVQGAHTLGFNHASVGISVIGNFESGKPNKNILWAVARVASWKLDAFGRDPLGKVTIKSTGSDKYGAGKKVKLRVIDGHRDTNDTACPGRYLYAALPNIRRRAARRINASG